MSSAEERCAALLRNGEKIQAIKVWREHTGASLKVSKQIIEHFEQHGNWEAPTAIAAASAVEAVPAMTEAELKAACAALIEEGRKVGAVQLWRQQTRASLLECRAQVESFEKTGEWLAPGSVPRPGTPFVLYLMGLLLLGAVASAVAIVVQVLD